MTHAVTWVVTNKKKILNQADVWAVVTTDFNLLPQLAPANNIVQQEIKNATLCQKLPESQKKQIKSDNKS